MAFKSSIFAGCVSLLFSTYSYAYFIDLSAQAGTGIRPLPVQDNYSATDTATFWSVDTGLVEDPLLSSSAQASASVDLRTGEIKAFVQTPLGGDAIAYASMQDELTISLPSNMASTDIGIYFSINGTHDLNGGSSTINAFLDAGVFGPSRLDSFSCGNNCNDTVSDILYGVVNVQDGDILSLQATIQLILGTNTAGGVPSTIDFGHTGEFVLDLPQGVTYTSASGVFLSAVPVPAAVWLFVSGLIGLVGFTKYK